MLERDFATDGAGWLTGFHTMCMGTGTVGIPWVPWDSHGNASDNDYVMGMGVGVGIIVWE